MDDHKLNHANYSAETPNCENSWDCLRLRQLGIDPDADPIKILMQLFDHFHNLYCKP